MEAKSAGIVVAIFSSELAPDHQQYRDFTVSADDYMGGQAAAKARLSRNSNGQSC